MWNQHVFHIFVDKPAPREHRDLLHECRLFPKLEGYEQTTTGYEQRFPQLWNFRLNEQKAHGPNLGPAPRIIATGFYSRNTFFRIKKFFLRKERSITSIMAQVVDFAFILGIRGISFLDNRVPFCIISLLVCRVNSFRGDLVETNVSTQSQEKKTGTRFSETHEVQIRAQDIEAQKGQGKVPTQRLSLDNKDDRQQGCRSAVDNEAQTDRIGEERRRFLSW